MNEPKTPKRRGRPQKFPGEGARVSHSIRLKPAIAEQLAVYAEKNHRSLGEEMEYRINQSFEWIYLSLDEQTSNRLMREAESRGLSPSQIASNRVTAIYDALSNKDLIENPDALADILKEKIYEASLIARYHTDRRYLMIAEKELERDNEVTKQQIFELKEAEENLVDILRNNKKDASIEDAKISVTVKKMNLDHGSNSSFSAQLRFADAKLRLNETIDEIRSRGLLDQI